MIDDAKRAEMDQARAMVVDWYPPQWWQMYQRLTSEGFSEQQAMGLLCAYIDATCKV